MDASSTSNPLLSNPNNSDAQLQVQLHPLVILTVSDYVTRHTLRKQTGPIVGAILGAQHGRDITLEHAFECKVVKASDGRILLDDEWFRDRLQQHKDVHKVAQLDLVAWFTLAPASGPQPDHIPIHQQLLENYNESALLLAFHASPLLDGSTKGSKLPITVYETAFEAGTDGDDKHMQESGEGPQLVLRFRELPYTIETGEAEMIGVDFVAKGGGNATVTNGVSAATDSTTTKTQSASKAKGKAREEESGIDVDILSAEDEELIASLTTKANAIRMLQQRISLTKAYINSIPPCYLNTPPSATEPVVAAPHPQISHPILRSISATLSRLPLLTPPANEINTPTTSTHPSTFADESAQQKTDVALVGLLGSMGATLRSAQDMGKKAGVVERARTQAAQMQSGFGASGKARSGGSYPLRSGAGDDFGFGDMSAYTPPTQTAGDEGYVDDYEGEDFAGGSNDASGGGISLRESRGDDMAGALRGKGKGVLRRKHDDDDDEEMT